MTQARTKKTTGLAVKKIVIEIIEKLNRAHPDAKLDLNFSNPLELLIALILAAQARDNLVNQVTAQIFPHFRTAEDYARTSLKKLEQAIRKINFYRNKARMIQNCCREIVEGFRGKVPENVHELTTLPGVGRKTANIVLGNAFGQYAIGVDTHVMRLSQRLGLTCNTKPDKIEIDLTNLVPEKQRVRFCHLLQYHGRRVCIAKRPRCAECTINSLCPYPGKTVGD
ncbi:MAG: endonuclease III [Candidatus Binatia bacterium]